MEETRIDKYLWAIRLFKTRSLATKTCNAGKVKIDGNSVKPSQLIRVGDVFSVRVNYEVKTIEVVEVIEKRVGYEIAKNCYKDITPEEDKINRQSPTFISNERRDRGTGRPTKKERRDIEEFKDDNGYEGWEDW